MFFLLSYLLPVTSDTEVSPNHKLFFTLYLPLSLFLFNISVARTVSSVVILIIAILKISFTYFLLLNKAENFHFSRMFSLTHQIIFSFFFFHLYQIFNKDNIFCFPVNYMVIENLERYDTFFGDSLKVECPTGSGNLMRLGEVARELSFRLSKIFLPGPDGHRPCHG